MLCYVMSTLEILLMSNQLYIRRKYFHILMKSCQYKDYTCKSKYAIMSNFSPNSSRYAKRCDVHSYILCANESVSRQRWL